MEQSKPAAPLIEQPTLRIPWTPLGLWRSTPVWVRSVLKNPKAVVGITILMMFILTALFAQQIAPTTDPMRIGTSPRGIAPSIEHPLGTTRQGQDVFTQVVHGTGKTLRVGFMTGTIVMAIAITIGVTAGLIGGITDEALSLITNIFLVLPGLPLVIVIAGWLDSPGPDTIILVLGLTSWAWGARVLRSQTLALRNSEFVEAARVSGEPIWRIVFVEILPNMTSLVASAYFGAVLYAILTESGLSYIGLGNANEVTWGTILYWAQNNQALLTGHWWTFIPPGICIALVGLSLTLINYAIDEITNPRLAKE